MALPGALGAATPVYTAAPPFHGYKVQVQNFTYLRSTGPYNRTNGTHCNRSVTFLHAPTLDRKTGRTGVDVLAQVIAPRGGCYGSATEDVYYTLSSPMFRIHTSGTYALREQLKLYLNIVGTGVSYGNHSTATNSYSFAIYLGMYDWSTGVTVAESAVFNHGTNSGSPFNVTLSRTYSLPVLVALSKGDNYQLFSQTLATISTSATSTASNPGGAGVQMILGGFGHTTVVKGFTIS